MKFMNSTMPFFIVMSFLMIIGCNTDTGVNNDAQLNFESGAFALFDFEDAVAAVEDATTENPMRMNPDLLNGDFFRNNGPFGPRGPKGPSGRGGPDQIGRARKDGRILGQLLVVRFLDLEKTLEPVSGASMGIGPD